MLDSSAEPIKVQTVFISLIQFTRIDRILIQSNELK